ncbi:hypothetical protein PLESTM_000181700 [Pleodorina starrii]|nr:hypothetical protein PLESTM_000181700 [Pleodorina starrii]
MVLRLIPCPTSSRLHESEEHSMLAAADAICDPNVERCKTPIYTYETKCSCCCGTGFVKSRANGHHASLSTCLLCHGLGYVRRTTARFAPDNGPTSGVFTLARPEPDPKHKAGKGKAKPKH